MQLALSTDSPKDDFWEKTIRNSVVHDKCWLRQGGIYRSSSVSYYMLFFSCM